MKNNYVLTIQFSTENPLDVHAPFFDAISAIGCAMTTAFGVDSLVITKSTLRINPPQTLAKQDKSGRWHLPNLLGRNHHV